MQPPQEPAVAGIGGGGSDGESVHFTGFPAADHQAVESGSEAAEEFPAPAVEIFHDERQQRRRRRSGFVKIDPFSFLFSRIGFRNLEIMFCLFFVISCLTCK
ncbi:unnamed protein product [Linum tenue]|uniref:Uncharacterized protein n=1 Tax=Linum tenue TaxID=586396 RepID=A0AAV0SBU7_9ROSI|nr:unnamed protein product [Linum tenue]